MQTPTCRGVCVCLSVLIVIKCAIFVLLYISVCSDSSADYSAFSYFYFLLSFLVKQGVVTYMCAFFAHAA